MEYIQKLNKVEKIVTASPFIFYIIVLCIGIINSQLEMTATFMFGTIIVYLFNTIMQYASSRLSSNTFIASSECQFFNDHIFYQSYRLPSFSYSFLWFFWVSLILNLILNVRYQMIGIILCVTLLLVLYPLYIKCFNSRTDSWLNLIFTMMIGGGTAILYYYIIIYISMNRSDYLLFSRPISNLKQCIPVISANDQ